MDDRIAKVEVLELKPDDRLVLTLAGRFPQGVCIEIAEQIRKWAGLPDGRVLVLKPGDTLQVVRSNELVRESMTGIDPLDPPLTDELRGDAILSESTEGDRMMQFFKE